MSEQKPCVRCGRPIDSFARSCVYCSWDQAKAPPAEMVAPSAAPAYTPPPDNRLRNWLFGVGAFAGILFLAFAFSLLHRSEADEGNANTDQKATSPASTPRSTVVLIPVEGGMTAPDQSPVTSAPPVQQPGAGNPEPNGERTDATALPSRAYSLAAQRARLERNTRPNSGIVDPRTIAGEIEPRRVLQEPAPASETTDTGATPQPRTKPIPLYQPVPAIELYRAANARLILTIGTEGRVSEINIAQSIPGEMPRILAAVQNWRFQPATENGHPVTSTFAVDITVRPR